MHLTQRIGFCVGVLALSACQGGGGGQDFISDDPAGGGYGGDYGEDGGGETGGLSTGGDSNGDPGGQDGGEGGDDNGGDVDISEADIVQMEGDRLYALSSFSGLT